MRLTTEDEARLRLSSSGDVRLLLAEVDALREANAALTKEAIRLGVLAEHVGQFERELRWARNGMGDEVTTPYTVLARADDATLDRLDWWAALLREDVGQ